MADTMCAVQVKYGAFTNYFLPPNLVIQVLEAIAMDSVDEDTQQPSVPWNRLAVFLQLNEGDALARAREAGVDLRHDDGDRCDAPDGWFAEWGRVSDFLDWFHNLRVMLEGREFNAFVDQRTRTITFDFS